ncbi:MAG TPA: GNAT family N-acetyltransferase [Kofleriaceae bacterium]|nr:GNAT family N-acetyltransferase [Kofleriaceae bacterium]
MRHGGEWSEEIVLGDAIRARLRLVQPTDKTMLRAAFEVLSPESRFLRFFQRKASLTDDELRYLTEMDQIDHLALGAVMLDDAGDEVEGLGVARFVKLAGRAETAEAAVVVADRIHGMGLGRLLFERLELAAVERGIERFRCEALAANAALLALVEGLAPDAEVVEQHDGVVVLEWSLKPAPLPSPLAAFLSALFGDKRNP